MSTTDQQLKTFLNDDGTTSYIGQQRAGTWEASAGGPLSSQRPWETAADQAAREDAYRRAKGASGT